jgi:hypothetical protein
VIGLQDGFIVHRMRSLQGLARLAGYFQCHASAHSRETDSGYGVRAVNGSLMPAVWLRCVAMAMEDTLE